MKTLSLYIIKEQIGPFFMSLGIILFLFILNVVMKMMTSFVGKDIDIIVIIEFFYLSMGWILALAVPMSALVASLTAYGRISQDNEYSVMQSSGISVYRLMLPSIVMGILLSFGMIFFHNNILPEMNHRNKIVKRSISRTKPLAVIEPGVFVTAIPGFVIKAERVDNINNILHSVVVLENSETAKYRRTITAKTGEIYYDNNTDKYNLVLNNGEISNLDPKKPNGYFRAKYNKMVLTKKVVGVNYELKNNSYYSDREKSIDSLRSKIIRLKKRKVAKNIISSVEIELYKKYALSFACLILIMIGAPLGLMSGKSGIGASAVLSILIFTIYYFFLTAGEDLGDRGKLSPFFAMWNGNIVIGIFSFYLIYLASKSTRIHFGFLMPIILKIKKLIKRK